MKPINVISLFDGMSCGQIALQREGIPVANYFASEIDKYAIKVTMANWPGTIQLGSVCDISVTHEGIFVKGVLVSPVIPDLLIGGSPCQGFSFAGKQLNFDDPRSALFFEYVRIYNEIKAVNPDVKFLLENVKMKKEYQTVITEYMGVEPIEVNSALVSAQNRKRLYWTNIPGFVMPEDKGILLRDIVHENEFLDVITPNFNVNPSARGMNGNVKSVNSPKSDCLTTNKGEGLKIGIPLEKYIVPYDKAIQILEAEVIKGKVKIISSKTDGVTTLNPKRQNGSQTYQQDRVYDVHGKMVCLSAELSGRFNIFTSEDYIFGCITPDRVDKRQNGQRFSDGRKFYTLTAQDKHGILIEGYIRKLTPIECERLQTVSDNYTNHVSDSQRYKMLGNGWTIDVIVEFFKNLMQANDWNQNLNW